MSYELTEFASSHLSVEDFRVGDLVFYTRLENYNLSAPEEVVFLITNVCLKRGKLQYVVFRTHTQQSVEWIGPLPVKRGGLKVGITKIIRYEDE